MKFIKKYDVELSDLIIYRYKVCESLTNFKSAYSNESVKVALKRYTSLNEFELEQQFNIVLATIDMIKSIKYDYNNTSISYFNENNKIKKVFKNKKLCIFDNSFYFINRNQLNKEKFFKHLIEENPVKTQYTLEEINIQIILYFRYLKNNAEIIDDEYAKLVLGKNYKEYVSNRIDGALDVFQGLIKMDMLLHRKVLLPKNGVLLLVANDKVIESILVKEVFKFDCNHIVTVTRYKDGKELINVIALKEKGLLKEARYWIYRKESVNIKQATMSYVMHFLLNTKGSVDDKEIELKYEVISPTYWKYRDRGYKSENDTTDHKGVVIKREFEIEIAPFLRKIKGTASSEAQALAKKLGIILENGYTIVKPHTRHYNSEQK